MTPNETPHLATGLQVQLRSIHALMIRDMMLRYGRNNIGFLWVVLEPMILTVGVLIVFSTIKSTYEHGTHIVGLALTGYMPLTLWRHTTGSGSFLVRRSLGVLYHRKLTLLDVLLARMALEFIGATMAFVAVYSVLLTARIVEPISDVGLLIFAWIVLGMLAAGVALNIAALTEYSEASEKFIQPAQYLMVPLSGIFFMVDWLPTEARYWIWFNPLTHSIEMFRAGFFGDNTATHYEAWYPALFVLFLWAGGLSLLETARHRLSTG
jgi:capsular polysaccharide transport system permease protein